MGLIDLHTHSTASDGEHAPTALAELALAAGIAVLALTDHDTMAGVAELREAALGTPLTIIAGLELSAEHDGPGVLHLLIYGADPEAPELAALLADMVRSRQERGPRILARLARLGIHISWDELCSSAGRTAVGKAHLAGLMVEKGHVASCDEAFTRYLNWGQPAYVKRLRWPSDRCLAVARAAGGISVLAHPVLMENSCREQDSPGRENSGVAPRTSVYLERLVSELVGQGLGGIEAYYPGQTPEQTERYLALAARHDLLVTGGTDFHGERVKAGVRLGVGSEDGFRVPPETADSLLAAIAAQDARLPERGTP